MSRTHIPTLAVFTLVCACNAPSAPPDDAPPAQPAPAAQPAPTGPMLLLSQAQFEWVTNPDTGKRKPVPGPAKLIILRPKGEAFEASVLEDADSRVFHKAICQKTKSGLELVTIAATDAHLKTWSWKDNSWQGTSHWKPTFGGKWDRLRDFELGDIDGDGNVEMVLATHDQGVIAVAKRNAERWEAKEIWRKPDTFVHEIELGDIDGDGKLEIYSTPSAPNKSDHSQSGSVRVFRPAADGYSGEDIATFDSRHAKEILVADVDGDGTDELYVSVEAKTKKGASGMEVIEPLEIRRYQPGKKKWKSQVIATLPKGIQARVMLKTKLKKDGPQGLVVTTMKDGVWWLSPDAKLKKWKTEQIDVESAGFEHAAAAVDLDGDGKIELYVASDNHDAVRRYVWDGAKFQRSKIYDAGKSDLTWAIEACL